jgi:hypothetical protein
MCLMNVGCKQKRDMYIHEKMMLGMMVVMLLAAVVWWVN